MPEIICPNCGRHNTETARYCASCSVNLGDASPKDAHGRPHYERSSPPSLFRRITRILRGISANQSHK